MKPLAAYIKRVAKKKSKVPPEQRKAISKSKKAGGC